MYKVDFTATAKKDLKKLSIEVSERVIHALLKIRDDPFSHINRLKISSDAPMYYMRVGDYRIIMTIEKANLLIMVVEIGHRSVIYRKYKR